jgi:hypothetical protein
MPVVSSLFVLEHFKRLEDGVVQLRIRQDTDGIPALDVDDAAKAVLQKLLGV